LLGAPAPFVLPGSVASSDMTSRLDSPPNAPRRVSSSPPFFARPSRCMLLSLCTGSVFCYSRRLFWSSHHHFLAFISSLREFVTAFFFFPSPSFVPRIIFPMIFSAPWNALGQFVFPGSCGCLLFLRPLPVTRPLLNIS